MITKNVSNKGQVQIVSLDQLVPEDHILRKIDRSVDFSFIYDLVEDKYSSDNGRPSIDPVMLIKIPIIQYMFGIKSMRQTIKDIEVNVAYKWFLGLDFFDPVPHFSTFGKNYKRRFEDTDLFEQIFANILMQCMKYDLVDPSTIFVDATHVKAAANRKKSKKILVARKTARFYDEQLKSEINADREAHGKKPLKDKEDDNSDDDPGIIVADAGYKTPAIAKLLIDDGVIPVFPYTRPMTKEGFFKKYEYVYDEYFDCCICPNNQILKYATTNREGYREYKSNPDVCERCPYISQCTQSKNHQKVVTRHLWQDYIDTCEDIRHSTGMKEVYNKRKETIERIFGVAKENHCMRYTQQRGKAKMAMKGGLTFACLNMKKLAKLLTRRKKNMLTSCRCSRFSSHIWNFNPIT